ncbi:hypothetical protein [Tenacibaculum sp. UWU-22]|uniref:hypothetical protein n=1 Tax=Tenacibaculum sp. UWU-22 TaxID=3234187 RepID=UPI0034DAC69E
MKDNIDTFFAENDFDIHEPPLGHFNRFEKKLKTVNKPTKINWKWLSVAASVFLLLGFWLGKSQQKQGVDLGNISPKMKQTQNYYLAVINKELKKVEKQRTLETETIIENALEEIEDLEDSYNELVKELTKNGYEKKIVYAMINNYQQRLKVLENVLELIDSQQKNKKKNYEETHI